MMAPDDDILNENFKTLLVTFEENLSEKRIFLVLPFVSNIEMSIAIEWGEKVVVF